MPNQENGQLPPDVTSASAIAAYQARKAKGWRRSNAKIREDRDWLYQCWKEGKIALEDQARALGISERTAREELRKALEERSVQALEGAGPAPRRRRATKAETLERLASVKGMLEQGLACREIASALGVSSSRASALIQDVKSGRLGDPLDEAKLQRAAAARVASEEAGAPVSLSPFVPTRLVPCPYGAPDPDLDEPVDVVAAERYFRNPARLYWRCLRGAETFKAIVRSELSEDSPSRNPHASTVLNGLAAGRLSLIDSLALAVRLMEQTPEIERYFGIRAVKYPDPANWLAYAEGLPEPIDAEGKLMTVANAISNMRLSFGDDIEWLLPTRYLLNNFPGQAGMTAISSQPPGTILTNRSEREEGVAWLSGLEGPRGTLELLVPFDHPLLWARDLLDALGRTGANARRLWKAHMRQDRVVNLELAQVVGRALGTGDAYRIFYTSVEANRMSRFDLLGWRVVMRHLRWIRDAARLELHSKVTGAGLTEQGLASLSSKAAYSILEGHPHDVGTEFGAFHGVPGNLRFHIEEAMGSPSKVPSLMLFGMSMAACFHRSRSQSDRCLLGSKVAETGLAHGFHRPIPYSPKAQSALAFAKVEWDPSREDPRPDLFTPRTPAYREAVAVLDRAPFRDPRVDALLADLSGGEADPAGPEES